MTEQRVGGRVEKAEVRGVCSGGGGGGEEGEGRST